MQVLQMSGTGGLEVVDCPACGPGVSSVEWMDDGKPTRYVRCGKCGTVRASPRTPRAERMAQLSTTFGLDADARSLEVIRRPALRREAEVIKTLKAGGRLLDIGCSTGALFEFFDQPEWQNYGVELSPSAADYAMATHAAQVHIGTLQEAPLTGIRFDVVTMIDMFYYVDDPRAELEAVRRTIHPDGLLCVEIPGESYTLLRSCGLVCWMLDHRWTRLHTDSSYLYWYSHGALENLMIASGFKVLHWEVIPSPTKSGLLQQMGDTYGKAMTRVTRRWPTLLDWTTKYLCVAQAD
jgi:SAM-dependent methyltransferase